MAEIHVMVVEDDPMVMEITCGYIQSIPGFSIAARAGSGSDALRQLARCKVELLILDIYNAGDERGGAAAGVPEPGNRRRRHFSHRRQG